MWKWEHAPVLCPFRSDKIAPCPVSRGPAVEHELREWRNPARVGTVPLLLTGQEEMRHALRYPCEGLMTRQSGGHWSWTEKSLTFQFSCYVTDF